MATSSHASGFTDQVLKIPLASPTTGSGTTAAPTPASNFLLACLRSVASSALDFTSCVVYLHGFPDQSCDHRQELVSESSGEGACYYGHFCRLPRKLAEAFVTDDPSTAFCAFNFRGTPGSHIGDQCAFKDKAVSHELADVAVVLRYLAQLNPRCASFHLVGLSTGAIIGALARNPAFQEELALSGCGPKIASISIIAACGVKGGMEAALNYDFLPEQLADFEEKGHCQKGFWLPKGSVSNPEGAVALEDLAQDRQTTTSDTPKAQEGEMAEVPNTELVETPKKAAAGTYIQHYLQLGAQYRDDFLRNLNVHKSVTTGTTPLLVIHGGKDVNIPLAEGKAVFAAAAEPKEFVEIPQGNHLLTNTKDLKKAVSAIRAFLKSKTPKLVPAVEESLATVTFGCVQ